jgi:hypothetical protein
VICQSVRAQHTYPTFLFPTVHLYPPALARAPPVIVAAVHMEMAVAPGRREALGKLSRHLSCSSIVGTLLHDHAVGSSMRPQMLGRGALDVSGRLTTCVCVACVCVACVYMCVHPDGPQTVEAWEGCCCCCPVSTHVYHAVDCGLL